MLILWIPESMFESPKELKRNIAASSLVFSLTALILTWAKMIETLHIYVTMFYKVLKTILIAFVSKNLNLYSVKKHSHIKNIILRFSLCEKWCLHKILNAFYVWVLKPLLKDKIWRSWPWNEEFGFFGPFYHSFPEIK